MKQRKKALASPFDSIHREESEVESNALDSLSEEEPYSRLGKERRYSSNFNDFSVEILEFEGKLDSVKRIFY